VVDAIVYLCLLWGMAEEYQGDINSFLDDHGFVSSKTKGKFDPATGEVSYDK